MTKSRALFLDRDGVINVDKNYVHTIEDCEFIDGIFDLVKQANLLGFKVLIVTNQSGIARNYYSEAQFIRFSEWMKSEFLSHGASIDAIYFCPHHPEHGNGIYLTDCACRKPKPGMLLQAQAEFNIEMTTSIMVGDHLTDIEAAYAAKIGNRYLFTHQPASNDKPKNRQASKNTITFNAITALDQVDLKNKLI